MRSANAPRAWVTSPLRCPTPRALVRFGARGRVRRRGGRAVVAEKLRARGFAVGPHPGAAGAVEISPARSFGTRLWIEAPPR